jgi:hypothetical protein
MATKQVKCDDCKREDCPQRIVGAVCAINQELIPLIDSVHSRDPILMSQFIVSIVGSEYGRYEKAKKVEAVGEEEEFSVVDKFGEVKTIKRVNQLDNNISTLAMNMIKAGKLLNEILNPPKAQPFLQQNNQYNIKVGAVDQIRALSGTEQEKVLKFIDDKLDAQRSA